MRTLAILDPSLQSFNGHFLTYDNAVAKGLKEEGFSSLIFAAKDCKKDLPSDAEIIPTFQDGLEPSFQKPFLLKLFPFLGTSDKKKIHDNFLNNLRAELTPSRLGEKPVLFMHTITHRQIFPLVDWLCENKKLEPTLVLFLRYAPSPNPYYPLAGESAGYKEALHYIEKKKVAPLVKLATDSTLLRDEYNLLTDLPVSVFPIPHTSEALPEKKEGGTITLTYLGNARATKGFQYLQSLVPEVNARIKDKDIAFRFQANVMFERDRESVRAVELLRQEKNVTLLEEELSMEEYADLLHSSSLVIVPYQRLYYYAQTSGILAEALGAGIPVIVPDGTWMAAEIEGKNVGKTFYPGDVLDLVDKTCEAIDEIEELTNNARNLQEEWTNYHSVPNFTRAFIQALEENEK